MSLAARARKDKATRPPFGHARRVFSECAATCLQLVRPFCPVAGYQLTVVDKGKAVRIDTLEARVGQLRT